MTTYSQYANQTWNVQERITNKGLLTVRKEVNFARQNLDAGRGDVMQIYTLPSNCWVLMAFLNVKTAAPANSTVNFGYGTNPDYWGRALRLDSTGVVAPVAEDSNASVNESSFVSYKSRLWNVPLYFSTGDTVDVVATTHVADVNIVSGKVELNLLMWHLDNV